MDRTACVQDLARDDVDPQDDPIHTIVQVWHPPEPGRLVIAAGQDGLAVGTERHGTDLCCMGAPMGCPVAASHSRAVRSALPVSTALPSGLNDTEVTQSWCSMGRRNDGLPGGRIPESG